MPGERGKEGERVRDDFPVSVFNNWKNALVLY